MSNPPVTQMAREIAEQPDAVRRTLGALLPQRDALRGIAEGRRRVLFAARGSSDNAAIYGRYLLETQAGVVGGLASPSVATHYRSRLDLDDTLVVCVSQSGATEEIVATEEWARSCGAATVGGHQRRGLAPGGVRDPGPGHPGRSRARGAGDQDLPVPARRDGGARHRAGARTHRARRRAPAGAGRGGAAADRADRHRRGGRGAGGRGVLRGVGTRPDDGHRARDRPEAGGDLPAPGARLLVRRPAARPDLGGHLGHDRGPRRGVGRPDGRPDASSWPTTCPDAAPRSSGSAGTRPSRPPAPCTSPAPT